MARLKCTRHTLHQDASPDPKGHGLDAKATAMSLRCTASNRAGGRCDIPTPKQFAQLPVSRSCTATEEMPSSVESGAGPSIRGGSWGAKWRMDFAMDVDGESDASGSKSNGYVAMKTRIATRKKERDGERAQTAGKPARGSNTTKRVMSSAKQGLVEENETRARALTTLLGRALDAVKHHEENDYPKKSDCTALIPLSKAHEPCSKSIRHTELMEGLGDTYSENYDIRPRRKESLVNFGGLVHEGILQIGVL